MFHPKPSWLNKEREATSFLVLRWSELFGPKTIDSFQPRLNNLPGLIYEIQNVCERSTKYSAGYLQPLQEELKSHLVGIRDRGWLEGFDVWELEKLVEASTPLKAHRLASLLNESGFKQRFEARIFDEASNVATLLPKAKSDADDIMGQLATIAVQGSVSEQLQIQSNSDHILGNLATIALHRGSDSSFAFQSPKPEEEDFSMSSTDWMQRLLARMRQPRVEFICGIEVPPLVKISTERLKHVFIEAGFDVSEATSLSLEPPLKRESLFIKNRYPSTSAQDALAQHLRRCKPVVDMLAFYLADNTAGFLPQDGWVGVDDESLVLTKAPVQPENILVNSPVSKIPASGGTNHQGTLLQQGADRYGRLLFAISKGSPKVRVENKAKTPSVAHTAKVWRPMVRCIMKH